MLKIKNYSKSYTPDKKTVENVSIEVKPGDLFAFIGHNGAGKTTTIKSVVGVLPFEEGTIEIDGINVVDNPVECKKRIAFIPDNPDVYEALTGTEYLNFIGDIYRVPPEKRRSAVEKYADMFEIKDSLNSPISSFSHGMKQKLEFIAAFMHEPKLMILDEPFVGLDPKAAFTVKAIMKEFCDAGGAIFFSTHVLEVAEKLCNKIAIIKGGKLVASGTMEEVKGQSSLEEVFMELIDHE